MREISNGEVFTVLRDKIDLEIYILNQKIKRQTGAIIVLFGSCLGLIVATAINAGVFK